MPLLPCPAADCADRLTCCCRACRVSVYPAVADAASNARYYASSASGSTQSGTYTGGSLQADVSCPAWLPCLQRLTLPRTAECSQLTTELTCLLVLLMACAAGWPWRRAHSRVGAGTLCNGWR